jgi:cytochrome c biogenesis protein CcmG, thiol:disulfide interchange protein DsbE
MSGLAAHCRLRGVHAVLALMFAGCGEAAPAASPSSGAPMEACNVKVGQKAPSFTAPSGTGAGAEKVSLPEGKVTIVDFWATWCGPCAKSFPKYQELYVKYKASGLEVVGVSVDDQRKGVPEWVKERGTRFPIAWDEGHRLAKCWKPNPMPTMFIIDRKGVVRHVHREWHDGDEREVEEQVKALL